GALTLPATAGIVGSETRAAPGSKTSDTTADRAGIQRYASPRQSIWAHPQRSGSLVTGVAADPPAAYRPAYPGVVMACVILATIMQTLDATIANVALPHMRGTLSA